MRKILLGLRGGGVKTPGIGVMKAFEENNMEVAAYSGTSIGAILATLGATGVNADEILYLVKKFVRVYSAANRLRGGKGSYLIEQTVNNQCGDMRFRDLKKPLYISANSGGLLYTEHFIFSKETTPDVTLGEACRASCSFPFAYERLKLNVNGERMKFWDGGMAINPYFPYTGERVDYVMVLATFKKAKTNTRSIYRGAWMVPEQEADFVIKPFLGNIGLFGTEDDIHWSAHLGYIETLKNIDVLKEILSKNS